MCSIQHQQRSIRLGDTFPNFTCDTNEGKLHFHDFIGNSWAILFSHPADYTPVCTTELSRVAQLSNEFKKRGVKLIALSCNDAASHNGWINDLKHFAGIEGNFPFQIIADDKRDLAIQLGMLDPDEKDAAGVPLTCRAVFIIGPDKTLKLSLLYPATTGRNFDEILRVVDSLILTSKHPVATPVDWKPGDKCMVQPSVKQENLAELFPKGVETVNLPSGKGYLRYTPQP